MKNMENEETHKMPLIGDEAPKFKAKTTMGEITFPDDYKENG
jgi:peroxiredoxin (alkyl hydroperoxide reductase subunit C)